MRITRYLWINNLPPYATEEDVRSVLNSHGKIQNVRLHDSDQNRGAVVAFVDTKSATKAIDSSVKLHKTLLRLQYCESSGVLCNSSSIQKTDTLQKSDQRPQSTSPSDSKSILGEEIETDSTVSSPYSSRSSSPQCTYPKKMSSAYSPIKRGQRKTYTDSGKHNKRDTRGSRISRTELCRGLRVTNLPLRSSDTNLREGLFHEYKKYGKITSIVVKGAGPGRFAHLTFKLNEDAEKAHEHSKGKMFFGASIRCELVDGLDVEDPDLCPPEHAMDEYHPKATKTLFVGNLCSSTITQEELRRIFHVYGDIIEIDIKTQTNQPGTSYAFVQYCDIRSVVRALCDQESIRIFGKQVKLGFGKSQPSNVVWLDNLSPNITEDYLHRQFGRYGRLNHVVLDKKLFRALLYFDSIEAAQRALNETRNRTLIGRKVQIDYATYECQVSFMRKINKVGQYPSNLFNGDYTDKFREILNACCGGVLPFMDESWGSGTNRRNKDSSSFLDVSVSSRSKFGTSLSHHSNSRSGSPGRGNVCSSRTSPVRDITNSSGSNSRGHLLPNPGLSNAMHYKHLPGFQSGESSMDRRQNARNRPSSGRFDEPGSSRHRSRYVQGRKSTVPFYEDYSRTHGSLHVNSPDDLPCLRTRSHRRQCATSSCSESISPEHIEPSENWTVSSSTKRNSEHDLLSRRHNESHHGSQLSSGSQKSLNKRNKTAYRRTTTSGSSTPCEDGRQALSTCNNFTPEPSQAKSFQSENSKSSEKKTDYMNGTSAPSNFKPQVPPLDKPTFTRREMSVVSPNGIYSQLTSTSETTKAITTTVTSVISCTSNYETLTKLQRERAELLRQLSLLQTASTSAGTTVAVTPILSTVESILKSNGGRLNKVNAQVPRLSTQDFPSSFPTEGGSAGQSSSSDPGDALFSPLGQISEMSSPPPPPPPPPPHVIPSPLSQNNVIFHHNHHPLEYKHPPTSSMCRILPPAPSSPLMSFESIASPPPWDTHSTTIESDLPFLTRHRLPSESSLSKNSRDPRLVGTEAITPGPISTPLWVETNCISTERPPPPPPPPLPPPPPPEHILSPRKSHSSISEMSDSEHDSLFHTDAVDSSLEERIRQLDAKLMHSEKIRPTVDYSKFRIRRKSDIFPPQPQMVVTTASVMLSSPHFSPTVVNSPFNRVSPPVISSIRISSPPPTSRPSDTSEFVKSMLSNRPQMSTAHTDFTSISLGNVSPSCKTLQGDKHPSSFLSPTVHPSPVHTVSPVSSVLSSYGNTIQYQKSCISPNINSSTAVSSTTIDTEVVCAVFPAHRIISKAAQNTSAVVKNGNCNHIKSILKRDTVSISKPTPPPSKDSSGLQLKDLFSPQATQQLQKEKERKFEKKTVTDKISEREPILSSLTKSSEVSNKRKLTSTSFPHSPKSPKIITSKVTNKIKESSNNKIKGAPILSKLASVVTNTAATTLKQKKTNEPSICTPKSTKKIRHAPLSAPPEKIKLHFRKLSDKSAPTTPMEVVVASMNTTHERKSMHKQKSDITPAVDPIDVRASAKIETSRRRRIKKRKESDEEDWKPISVAIGSTDVENIDLQDLILGGKYETMYDKIKRRGAKDGGEKPESQLKPEALQSLLKSRKHKKGTIKREHLHISDTDECQSDDSQVPSVSSQTEVMHPISPIKEASSEKEEKNVIVEQPVKKKRRKTMTSSKKSGDSKPPLLTRESPSLETEKIFSQNKRSRLIRPQSPEVNGVLKSDSSDEEMTKEEENNQQKQPLKKQKRSIVSKKQNISKLEKHRKIKISKTDLSHSKKISTQFSGRHLVHQVSDSSSSDAESVTAKSVHKRLIFCRGRNAEDRRCRPRSSSSSSSTPRISRSCSPVPAPTPSVTVYPLEDPVNKLASIGEVIVKDEDRFFPEDKINELVDDIPLLEKQIGSDLETGCESPLVNVDECYVKSTSETLDLTVPSLPINENEYKLTTLCSCPFPIPSVGVAEEVVYDHSVISPEVVQGDIKIEAEMMSEESVIEKEEVFVKILKSSGLIVNSPVVKSIKVDDSLENSGLALLSHAATQSLDERNETNNMSMNKSQVQPSFNIFTSSDQPVSIVSTTTTCVPILPNYGDRTVAAIGQPQHIALVVNTNISGFPQMSASSESSAFNKPTFVLTTAPLTSNNLPLTPVTISLVTPVTVCEKMATRPLPVSTCPSVGTVITTPIVSASVSPVAAVMHSGSSDQSSLTSYVQRVIERVKQEKDEESLHSREKVKRTKKSIQNSSASTSPRISVGVSVISGPPPQQPLRVTGSGSQGTPIGQQLNQTVIPKEPNFMHRMDSVLMRSIQKLSQTSEPTKVLKMDPYEPNFDEDYSQVQTIRPPSIIPVEEPLQVDAVQSLNNVPVLKSTVDEVIDSVVHGEFVQEEYVQRLVNGTLPSISPNEHRPRFNSVSNPIRNITIAPNFGQQHNFVDELHQQQNPPSNSLPVQVVASNLEAKTTSTSLLAPLRVLTLVANSSNPVLLKNDSFQPQPVHQHQISPRLVKSSMAASTISNILNTTPQQQSDDTALEQLEGVRVQDIAARYYLHLLNQQCHQQQQQESVDVSNTTQSPRPSARSPHEAAEYYAAATMAAMAVMQPEINRTCVPNSASSVFSEAFRLWWLDSQLPEDKYPLQWNGYLALKNDDVYVRMNYLAGNRDLIRTCMNAINDTRLHSVDDAINPEALASSPVLRIAQRMRLENSQLEGVQWKLREPSSFCMCLALAGVPAGSKYAPEVFSRNTLILQENFINYMQEKVAAGIISFPSSTESPFVMHIFPPCEFSHIQLQQISPELQQMLTQNAIPHMLIVVV